eukprot:199350-Rhodomonas_salina.1
MQIAPERGIAIAALVFLPRSAEEAAEGGKETFSQQAVLLVALSQCYYSLFSLPGIPPILPQHTAPRA